MKYHYWTITMDGKPTRWLSGDDRPGRDNKNRLAPIDSVLKASLTSRSIFKNKSKALSCIPKTTRFDGVIGERDFKLVKVQL